MPLATPFKFGRMSHMSYLKELLSELRDCSDLIAYFLLVLFFVAFFVTPIVYHVGKAIWDLF
jgi:hypothetical protein